MGCSRSLLRNAGSAQRDVQIGAAANAVSLTEPSLLRRDRATARPLLSEGRPALPSQCSFSSPPSSPAQSSEMQSHHQSCTERPVPGLKGRPRIAWESQPDPSETEEGRKNWGCFGRHVGECGEQVVMYHGTTRAAARSIWADGFVPSSYGMMGPGIYLSRDFAWASDFARSKAAKGFDRSERGVVLTCRVCRGASKRLGYTGKMRQEWQRQGVDSVHVVNQSAHFTEDCVVSPDRVLAVDRTLV